MEFRNKIIISALAGIAIYVIISIYADINKLFFTLSSFNWAYIPLILLLTLFNYALRFLKWDYYLRCLKIKISRRDSAGIFLGGLSMSITPVKLGETFKSYLLKEFHGVEISKTVPIVFAERFTDLIGLIILASIGYSAFKYGREVLLITIFAVSIVIIVIQSEKMFEKLVNVPLISRFAETLRNLYLSAYTLFNIKNLMIAVALSIFSWFFECLALFFVLKGFRLDINFLLPIFAFSFSTIAGAVSMVPGGLGVAESSMAGILIFSGITKTIAIASTLIIRFCTLWFGVLVGLLTLSIYGFKFKKGMEC
jgi:uncharacterized protein (TIRG00374 family)